MPYEAYIVSSFYNDAYKGIGIPSDKFNRLALRASDEIDKMTMNFVRLNGLSNLTDEANEAVKLATCVMAEALSRYDDLTGGSGVVVTSESSNGYNYTIDKSSVDAIMKSAKANAWAHLQRGGFYSGLNSQCGLMRPQT